MQFVIQWYTVQFICLESLILFLVKVDNHTCTIYYNVQLVTMVHTLASYHEKVDYIICYNWPKILFS